jgi:predicted PurR-regulated permease PerM
MTEGAGLMNTESKDVDMQTIEVASLSFSSYCLLCTLIAVCAGVIGSVLFFVVDVLGWDSTVQLGLFRLNDTETGIIVLFVGPFFAGLVGLVISLITYHLFLLAIRRFEDFNLTGIWRIVKPFGASNPQHQNEDHTSKAFSSRHPR